MNRMRTLFAPRLFWLAWIPMLVSSSLVPFYTSDKFIHWWGTGLQLVGIALVFWELLGSLKVFDRGRLKRDIALWWSAVWKHSTVGHASVDFQLPKFGLAAVMRGRAKAPEGATLPERLSVLEANVDSIDQDIGNLRVELAAEQSAREQGDTAEALLRDDDIQRLRRDVIAVTTGDAWLSIFGIGCLFVGVLLTGIA